MFTHFTNDTFVTGNDVSINAFDLGFLRGYGVFDYVQLYQGRPFHLFDHLKRLAWSAKELEMSLPKPLEEIEDIAMQLISKNLPIDAGIRFILTGGIGGEDLLLSKSKSCLTILFHPFQPIDSQYYTTGMRCVSTLCERENPCVKSTNYVHAVLAMKKARRTARNDAVYLSSSQELLEATTSNLFFFKNGTWITAPDHQVVNGVTRSLFIKLAAPHYPIEFRALPLREVESCEEAFLCSSVKNAMPLVQIDNMCVGNGLPGPHTKKMRDLFSNYLAEYFELSAV